MSGWAKKVFWKETTVEAEGDGFTVRLDGRALKTPAKASLVVPTKEMAEAIAEEWRAQEGEVDPTSMPVTRSANAAIDNQRVKPPNWWRKKPPTIGADTKPIDAKDAAPT